MGLPQVIWNHLLMTSSVPVLNANLHYEFHLTVVLAARNAYSICDEVKTLELVKVFNESAQAALVKKEKDKNSN